MRRGRSRRRGKGEVHAQDMMSQQRVYLFGVDQILDDGMTGMGRRMQAQLG